jgi:carboxypeptidase Q
MKTLAMRKACLMPIWAVLAIGVLILPAAPNASAQAPPPDKKSEEIEKQVQALKQSVEDLGRILLPGETQKQKSDSPAATQAAIAAPSSTQEQTKEAIARIREEGLNHSQVMQTLSYLTDVIGPRLTGSPELKRANEWSSDKLASWGLANAHLEAWGPFGRGWTLKRFSAQIVEPQDIPLTAYPKAWSPGFEQPITADVVYFEAKTEADLDKYKGKLKGTIVLVDLVREVKAHFEPLAIRRTDADLLQLANAGETRRSMGRRGTIPPSAPGPRANAAQAGKSPVEDVLSYFKGLFAQPAQNSDGGLSPGRTLSFLTGEGTALVVSSSFLGDGGTIFVASASVPGPEVSRPERGPNTQRRTAWSPDPPAMPAQIALATEQYNRLVRMIEQGEKLKMAVDLKVQFHNDDLMAYNTIAEIPGSDLADEIVMLGGHIDSWHAGTGATDDGTGVAAAMEAVRILKTLKLQPRRTIRIGLWSGEEQGLLGSRAYVTRHFGEYTEVKNAEETSQSKDQGKNEQAAKTAPADATPERKLVRQGEYEKFSVYFNFDEGSGKIRGIFLQGNEAARPIFRRWMEPFTDLGAETLTLENAGGTDHLSFNAIGLPGFHFIQDPIEYWSRTHHSNADVYDRVQADDMKQAATIIAALVYNAAMMDEKIPRKPTQAQLFPR